MSARTDLLQTLAGKRRLTAEDALAARPVLFDDMSISPDEAEALFRIDDTATETSPEWRMLFVEALTDYLVRQEHPPGYIDQAKADWLMARIAQDGEVKGDTELELLIHILEEAYEAPPALSTFALKQAAAFATAPDRRQGEGAALTADEVSRISRVVYAFASADGGAAVSRDEAEVLFDLNDAARGQANDPSWKALFVHAIGAALMTAAGYVAPTRGEALRRDAC